MIQKAVFKKLIMLLICAAFCLSVPLSVTAAEQEAKIEVKQTFTENNPPNGNDVTYVLTAKDGALLPGGAGGKYEFKISGSRTYDLKIPFKYSGTYSYTLSVKKDGRQADGYYFDDSIYDITLYVEITTTGLICTPIVKKQDGNKYEVEFTNGYGEAKPCVLLDPPVKKTVLRKNAVSDTFKFRLKAENPSNPMPEGSKNGEKIMTIKGAGEGDFGTWKYTRAGTYIYDVSEINTKNPDYRYDTLIYTITDVVTRKNNELKADRTIIRSDGRKFNENFGFTNEYVGADAEDPYITYDPNGGVFRGSKEPTNVQVKDGEVITIAEAATRDGYEFLYWKGSEYHPGDKYKVDGHHTFVAQWRRTGGSTPEKETDDDNTGNLSPSRRKSKPNTGDRNRMIFYICLGIAAAVVMIIVIAVAVRRRKKED